MTNQEKIYSKLNECPDQKGLSAKQLAELLNMSRSNVSHELNKLFKNKRVLKSNGRPVYYSVAKHPTQSKFSVLDNFVKKNGSLSNEVDQAKAAILYPPHGLSTLIFGETGVGKSMFAYMMYNFAVETGTKRKDSAFVVFNCADYATNPNLLLSQLFGSIKGAYTGATTDKEGLVEKASSGVLFLDEVHRLPPEGQEMLFTLMDTGEYRRLGETDNMRSSSALIICATTEDPSTNLLSTFIRRIPVTIQLPPLRDRTLDERLYLIKNFFKQESINLNREIYVSCNSIRAFLSYDCPNNIGQLKSDIQLICAKAYSDYLTHAKQDIRIDSQSLSSHVRDGLLKEKEHRKIWTKLTGDEIEFFRFHPNMESFSLQTEEKNNDIYTFIEEKLFEMKKKRLSDKEIENTLEKDIFNHFKKYVGHLSETVENNELSNLLSERILTCVDKVVSTITFELNRPLSNNIYTALALHINNLAERIASNKPIINPQLNKIKKSYPAEYSIAKQCKDIISEELDFFIPEDEIAYLTIFLLSESELPNLIEENVKIIIIAHGDSTASSIANVANRLLNSSAVLAIDAPLDLSPSNVLEKLREIVRIHLDATGFLLLIDMGSLTTFAEIISNEFKIPTKAIPMVSTLHAIEASRKTILGFPLKEIYQDVKLVNNYSDSMSSTKTEENRQSKVAIITACLTGEGGSVALKSVLSQSLNYDENLFEILPMNSLDKNYFRYKIQSIRKERDILFIVSSFPLDVNIRQFNMYDVISNKIIGELQELIDIKTTLLKMPLLLKENIQNFDGEVLFEDIQSFIKNIEFNTNQSLGDSIKVPFILHLAFMISRTAKGEAAIDHPEKETILNENPVLYEVIKSEYQLFSDKYHVVLDDNEACYLISYLTTIP